MAYIPREFSRIAATDGETDYAKAHGSDELCKILSDVDCCSLRYQIVPKLLASERPLLAVSGPPFSSKFGDLNERFRREQTFVLEPLAMGCSTT